MYKLLRLETELVFSLSLHDPKQVNCRKQPVLSLICICIAEGGIEEMIMNTCPGTTEARKVGSVVKSGRYLLPINIPKVLSIAWQ